MSEDGETRPFTPLDAVEMSHAFAGMGKAIWSFYSGLVDEGFSTDQALRLTVAYAHGLAGGKLA